MRLTIVIAVIIVIIFMIIIIIKVAYQLNLDDIHTSHIEIFAYKCAPELTGCALIAATCLGTGPLLWDSTVSRNA